MRKTGRVSQVAAWSILVLLVLVPCTGLLTIRKASFVWFAWAIVSLCVALNAVRLATLVYPESHSPRRAVAIALLALANVALSLVLALMPSAWISALH
jgi:hypothetical protein